MRKGKWGCLISFSDAPGIANPVTSYLCRRLKAQASAPAIAEREYNLSKAVSIPFTEATLTGGSLMQLAHTLKALVAGNQVGNGSLVRVVFSAGIDKAGLARAAF